MAHRLPHGKRAPGTAINYSGGATLYKKKIEHKRKCHVDIIVNLETKHVMIINIFYNLNRYDGREYNIYINFWARSDH